MALIERLKDRLRLGAPRAAASGRPPAPRLSLEARSLAERLMGRHSARLFKAPATSADAAPPDPSKMLFPADEPALSDERASLGGELQRSAAEIDVRAHELAARARAVAGALARRMDGETTLIALAFRFFTGVFWLALAAALLWRAKVGSEIWMGPVAEVAQRDALPLSWAFAISGGAGVVGAFLIAWTVFLTGGGDNNQLRKAASALGEKAADIAHEFDSALGRLRGLMDRNDKNPAAAVEFLSRTHLTALEAAVFFRSISFLAERTGERDEFRAYIARNAPRMSPVSDFAPGFFAGFIVGIIFIARLYPAPPAVIVHAHLPPITNYPFLLLSLLGGAFFYAIMRMIVDAARGLFTAPAETQAYAEALDAFRGGYIAAKAPRIESVIQRIEDALDVYKARLADAPMRGRMTARPEEDIPAWRKPAEPARFVETGFLAAPKSFLAAPKSFLADPPEAAGRSRRKIFSGPKPEAKRSGEPFKKPDGA